MTKNNADHRRQEVQQIVKNACDQLNAEGVDARNYVEQLAWLFFLKAFDETETRKEQEAAFDDTPYERRLTGDYAWSHWAKDTDHPDEMLEFVDGKLWIKLTSPDPSKGLGNDALAQRFRRIFDNVRNYSRRGVSFAKVVQQVDKLHFSSETDVIVLSEIYEDLLKRVAADSAGYAGEFYTQRHIIRAMVQVVQPQPGEHVYDPCFGTAGFLGEAADHLRHHSTLSGKQLDDLQHKAFFGLELKPLTYLLGSMNMILHGIEGANLELANTLEVHSQNVAEKDKYQVNRVEELPLAMIDAQTHDPADMLRMDLKYSDRTGEIYVMRHNPKHRWLYFPHMEAQHALLLKTYDSCTDGRCRFMGHSAFEDPTSPADAAMRESIEIRTMAFF